MVLPAIHRLRPRLVAFSLILWVAFVLRLWGAQQVELNIDESWSMVHILSVVNPPHNWEAFAAEPNNAFHLALASPLVDNLTNPLGLRLVSIFSGVLTVAVAGRIGYRLGGNKAALLAAFIVTLSFTAISNSQLGRPYALAILFGCLSFLSWLENRWTSNLFANLGIVFTHVGTVPVIFAQDIVMAYRIRQHSKETLFMWISNRVLIYGLFLGLYRLVAMRQLPSQPLPSLWGFVEHLSSGYYNSAIQVEGITSIGEWLIIVGVLAPIVLVLGWLGVSRRSLTPIGMMAVWIGISYATLVAIIFLRDGSLLLRHMSHVHVAMALLIALVLTQLKNRWLMAGVLLAYCSATLLTLPAYYRNPPAEFRPAYQQIEAIHGDLPLYTPHLTLLWALQVNNVEQVIDHNFMEYVAPDQSLPMGYYYLLYLDWEPSVPPEGCTSQAIWQSHGMRLYACPEA